MTDRSDVEWLAIIMRELYRICRKNTHLREEQTTALRTIGGMLFAIGADMTTYGHFCEILQRVLDQDET